MADKDTEFLNRLLEMFRAEADDHLAAMSAGLIELEGAPADVRRAEIVEGIFREAHSLKGAARTVKLAEIEAVCHALESVFAGLKANRAALSPALLDLLHEALDALGNLLASGAQAGAAARKPALSELVRRLGLALAGPPPNHPDRPPALPPQEAPPVSAATGLSVSAKPGTGTIRVDLAKLDAMMRQAEELLGSRLALGQHIAELREAAALLAAWQKKRAKVQPALRLAGRALERAGATDGGGRREMAKTIEYLDTEHLLAKALGDRLARLERSSLRDHRALSGMVDNLLRQAKEMHMQPFSSLLDAFPRLARELAGERGKQAELRVQGEKIEIDRRILEEMKDPLTHLLRNCIDHGIEKPPEREKKGKPARGAIAVAVEQKDSGKIEVLFSDDGAGIDIARVKAEAVRQGAISAVEADKLDEQEASALIFRSGVSTSPIVTELSGRGLGLAIVREKVERLGGAIALETGRGAGTAIRILLPLTLATFRGVLVRSGGQPFVIPATSVERVARVATKDILTVENRETVPLGGQAVALVRLDHALGVPRAATVEPASHALVAVIGSGSARVAFQVDEVVAEQEVLVKPLGRQLERVRNIAGAGVLGTGQVAPVLNVHDLLKSAAKLAAAPVAPAAGKAAAAQKRSILVVEDSITSRALLKNILEAAGYAVTTAVDGVDAYTALKTAAFDLVVSDVEMPRMDGFDLTAKVRADKQLADLPVVLVTALGTREHRERGIEVGANAYIVKSSFDQSRLLEIIRQMI